MASARKHPKQLALRRAERIRDFVVLGISASGLLGFMVLTGALGFFEGITAIIVLSLGALAYFVGSAPPAIDLAPVDDIRASDEAMKSSVRSLIHALPFPACYISGEDRIDSANKKISDLFRINHIEGAL